MSLELALAALRQAKRIDGTKASYRKDNPNEWQRVMAYLDGGPRPTGDLTLMGQGLVGIEDVRRGAQPPPPPPPPTGRTYPASYYTGPLGNRVPLPTKAGAFLGVYGPSKPDGTSTWEEVKTNIASRESAMGRKYDFVMTVDNEEEWSQNRLPWINAHGSIPVNAGLNFGDVNAVAAGQQDARIDRFADHYKAMGFTLLVRLMHEFNQPHLTYSSMGKEQAWIAAWKRVVDRFKARGATNVGFYFCPLEGGDRAQRTSAETCFDGLQSYIDWTGSDHYNFCLVGQSGCYSHPHESGWVDFGKLFNYGIADGARYAMWSPRKPFVIGETGTKYDPAHPALKGQWYRNVARDVKTMPALVGVCFFDVNATPWEPGNNWHVPYPESVPESLRGFADMARDPVFNTRA